MANNGCYIETYGIYPWAWNANHDLIHPDDLDLMRDKMFSSRILRCIDQSDDYIALKFGAFIFRARPIGYHICPGVNFDVGETVKIRNQNSEIIEIVYNNEWHSKRRLPMYFLQVNGKKKSRRYFEEELEKIPDQNSSNGECHGHDSEKQASELLAAP